MKTSRRKAPSASQQPIGEAAANSVDRAWKPLYRVGGAVGLSIVMFSLIQFIAFIASPPPSTVIGYFTLFPENALLGLLDLNLLSIVNYALLIPMVLALYAALRRAGQSFMIIATSLALVGIATYFASNTAFEMLSLSSQYEAASTNAQGSLTLATGQAMLAIYQGTAFDVSYVLLSVASLIISVVMLRSTAFGKGTACVGIVANALGLLAVGFFVPAIDVFLLLIAGVGLLIWYILVAHRFFVLSSALPHFE
jgi:hypothetical protein